MTEDRLSIMIADDEYWTRENLRTILDWEAYGLDFLPMATDGEDALVKMEANPADIVITDINMPYLSGVELMHKLRERWPNTVILVLSGYSDFEYVRQALLAGALDYLLKPITKSKLFEVLSRAMSEALTVQKTRKSNHKMQERLALAASTLLDRDFSQWLHDAKRQELAQTAEAQLFEYEHAFSSYRITLFKTQVHRSIIDEQQLSEHTAEAFYRIKNLIASIALKGQKMVIHDMYHQNNFLLISEADESALRAALPPFLVQFEDKIGTSVQAMVSGNYLTFTDLRKAYDEARNALLCCPCRLETTLRFAYEMEDYSLERQVTPAIQHQMEHAAKMQQRDVFDQLIKQSGLLHYAQDQWSVMEFLHCINSISWLIKRCVEGNAEQLLVIDTLMKAMIDSIDRLDIDEAIRLLRQMEDEYFITPQANAQNEPMRQIVTHVKNYIDTHYFDDLSLSQLAQRFSVDDSYLSRTFKQVVGCNLMIYLSTVRVERAKELMAQGKHNITEIAQLVGYNDYAYFSRVFKKLAGVSPKVYREEVSQ